jgi:leucine-zipper-like transcriptional regulator 1
MLLFCLLDISYNALTVTRNLIGRYGPERREEVKVLSTEKPGCRENNGVVIGDASRVYLFGGYNGTSWLNDLWSFDIDSQRWTCIQDSSDPVAIPPDEGNGALGDVPPRFGSVVNVRGRVPSRRFGYVSVVHNNKFVLFGGFDGSRWLNDMFEFDFNTRTWREIESRGTLPSVRSCPAWAKDDTHVYIQGGYDGVERKADFFACDLATYTWTEMPCLGTPPSPRYFHSCCLYGNKMFLYGGYSGNERLADMYAYDFETNHWSEVDCTNGDAPSGRSSLVAQVFGNCLYIFGGYNGITVLNDFYKFRLTPVSVPPPALVNDLTRLINHPELSDVTFLVEGNEVYANRAILSVRSEYFKVMLFSGGMREALQLSAPGLNRELDKRIEIKDVAHNVFLKVLEYLYTDTVKNISLEDGIHLMIVSELFMLDRLKALCEDIIRRDVNLDNVISILVTSHRHNAYSLKDIALEFILEHLNEPSIMIGLSDLKIEPDLLVEIIKRNSATVQGSPSSREVVHPPGPFGNGNEWGARR